MASWSRFHKIALISLGAVGGSFVYYNLNNNNNDGKEKRFNVYNSWTTNFSPSVQWDKNWDLRAPESLLNRSSFTNSEDGDNKYNDMLNSAKSRAVRHIILIRHGQYNIDGETDKERTLTPIGKIQASLTGKRLALLNIKWDLLIRSTMTRAQETADIIAKHLSNDLVIKDCQMIEEGAPIPPEPPVGHWKPEKSFFQDSARIEAAFRKYFHRAPPEQKEDSYTIMVCHANVIRFFVCKALQFPPEGWLRMSLNHGSITWITINPNGSVILRTLGDTGHMDPEYITCRQKRSSAGRRRPPKK